MLKQFLILVCLSVAFAERTTTQSQDSIHIINDSNNLNQDEFAAEALMAHNLYRRIHGVPSLRLNSKLVDLAVTRARELATDGKLNVKQILFNKENLGETVGTVGGFSSYNGISATQLWYSVVSKFDEEGESSNEGASFTQMVWKKTREVGFGIAKGRDGKFYFVAEYFPSGNIRGQYEDNVFQLTEEEMSSSSGSSKCVNQTIVDMWRKLLNKANLSEEGERVAQQQQSTTTESTPSAGEIVVEMPSSSKKLKSKLPVITQNEEIVRSTRRPSGVETESIEIESSSSRPVTSRPVVSASRTTTPAVEEEEETTPRATTTTTTRRIRPTTISSEQIEETETTVVRPVRPISKSSERLEEDMTTKTTRRRPVVVVDDVESTSTRRQQRPVVVETTESIRLTTVNPELIITAEPAEIDMFTTTMPTTRRMQTTERTTTPIVERITTTTPERQEEEEETTTTVTRTTPTTTERVRTTTEESRNRLKFRPSDRSTTVEMDLESSAATTALPRTTMESTTTPQSTTTTRKAVTRVSTLLNREKEEDDIDRQREPERETTVVRQTTVSPVTTRRSTVESSETTSAKLTTAPRMTPTVLEEANPQRPSKSKLLEQIKNAEEVRSTTRSTTTESTHAAGAHVHAKKELDEKEAEEESRNEKREESPLEVKPVLNKKPRHQESNDNE
jgi:hypothetical protein